MLLGNIIHVDVDKKLISNDKFDDLTTIDSWGNHERLQIKHTENDDRPLSLKTFTSDDRDLRLDRLISAMLAYRNGPGKESHALTFRIVLRDKTPIDPRLASILTPLISDPGPFVPTMHTIRLGFDFAALWNQSGPKSTRGVKQPFSFIFTADTPLNYADLRWTCQHLVVEVDAPPASGDLTTPGIAEQIFLTRTRIEVGAGIFPNIERSTVDVAAAIISTARAARQGRLNVTSEELLRRAQLRSDFGAVVRANPVDKSLEIGRKVAVCQLLREATELASVGGRLIVTGPPGHGKSWTCHQLLNAFSGEGWFIAEHYC